MLTSRPKAANEHKQLAQTMEIAREPDAIHCICIPQFVLSITTERVPVVDLGKFAASNA